MAALTLLRQGHPLAEAAEQRRQLLPRADETPFEAKLAEANLFPLLATRIDSLQVNVGKMCNQTCHHCHVDAGPDRREIMTLETMQYCLTAMESANIGTLDITGGAPEMNPNFRWFVSRARELGRHVIDRCNLTILLAPGFTDTPEFLAANRVEVVASLPCYTESTVDKQRGDGVFDKSIRAIRRLNDLGYGHDAALPLSLVYNPGGASLPPPQATLEATYKRELAERHGIHFTRLFTIANMPISRFLDDLQKSGKYESYMQKLIAAFNPVAAENVMCRSLVSVGWDGQLFDCDFNQMLDLRIGHIRDFDATAFATRTILTAQHCYGCTAGAGSSCTGAVVI